MVNPYRARVNCREFLNLPGFHDGAYVVCYVEDTSGRDLEKGYSGRRHNPQPRFILEIADCSERVNLSFEIDSALDRMNSFHKVDTLIKALEEFRAGLAAECGEVKRRARELRELEEAEAAKKANQATADQLALLSRYEEAEE